MRDGFDDVFNEAITKEIEETQTPDPVETAEPVETEEPAQAEMAKEPEEQPEQSETVPHAKFHATNEKAKKFEAENVELRERLARIEGMMSARQPQQQQTEPKKVPDPIEDLEAYNNDVNQRIEQRVRQVTMQQSERFASQQAGDNWASVKQWALNKCDQDAAFNNAMHQSVDPWGDALQAYNHAQEMAEFQKWKQSQGQPTQEQPKLPPNALKNGSGEKADQIQQEGEFFAEVFSR